MRCADCDEMLREQVLGKLPDGRLAFGLCASCLEAEGGVFLQRVGLGRKKRPAEIVRGFLRGVKRVKVEGRQFSGLAAAGAASDSSRKVVVRARQVRGGGAGAPGGQSTMVGLAGLVAAWGLMLAVSGATGTGSHPGLLRPSPFGSGTPAVFLGGAAALGVLAMGLLAATLSAQERRRLFLRAGQVGLSLLAVGVLVGGIARHDPRRDVWVVLGAAGALAGAAGCRRLERGPEDESRRRRGGGGI